jgi:hypothetical protein
MDYKGLRALLVVHGFITMAAGIVLTVAPGLIPSAVGFASIPVHMWSRIYWRALSSGLLSCRLEVAA